MRKSPTTEGRGFDQHILRLPIATKTLGSFSNRGYRLDEAQATFSVWPSARNAGATKGKLNRLYRVVLSYFNQLGGNATLFHCMKWKIVRVS
jgi:hypothetical protein